MLHISTISARAVTSVFEKLPTTTGRSCCSAMCMPTWASGYAADSQHVARHNECSLKSSWLAAVQGLDRLL